MTTVVFFLGKNATEYLGNFFWGGAWKTWDFWSALLSMLFAVATVCISYCIFQFQGVVLRGLWGRSNLKGFNILSPNRFFWNRFFRSFPPNLEDTKSNTRMLAKCIASEAIWMFPKIGVPPKHPKMIIFSRKTNGCWVPLFSETSIYRLRLRCSILESPLWTN